MEDDLTTKIVSILAYALPYLLKGVEKIGEGVSKGIGEDAWKWVKTLWDKLRPKVQENPAALEAVQGLAASPGDKEAQSTLRVQLKKLLSEDKELAEEVAHLWQEAPNSVKVTTIDDHSISTGNVNRSILITGTGDVNIGFSAPKAKRSESTSKGSFRTTPKPIAYGDLIIYENSICDQSIKADIFKIFTSDNPGKVGEFRKLFLIDSSLGTSKTPYVWIDEAFIGQVVDTLHNNRFFHIFGNAGRGKTFYSFLLMEKALLKFDCIIYYYPSSTRVSTASFYSTAQFCIEAFDNVLFVIDNCHIVDRALLRDVLYSYKGKISFLLISRRIEEDIIPEEYLSDSYKKGFNSYSEYTFKKIIEQFCQINKVILIPSIESAMREITNGANLVFLTHMLYAWKEYLQESGGAFDAALVERKAKINFLSKYERYKPNNWKYINHIVSALFQFEIRIDKSYLDPTFNTHLLEKDVDNYLSEKMIYKKIDMIEKIPYYVFSDFNQYSGNHDMKHASEFQFYLDAYDDLLEFKSYRGLDRLRYTKLLIEDYILFKPRNILEIGRNIVDNSEKNEAKELIFYLFEENPLIRQLIKEFSQSILVKN